MCVCVSECVYMCLWCMLESESTSPLAHHVLSIKHILMWHYSMKATMIKYKRLFNINDTFILKIIVCSIVTPEMHTHTYLIYVCMFWFKIF